MHSDEGDEMISPVEFIPLLEKSRLIIPVGEFVLNEAAKMCREMQQYIADFTNPATYSSSILYIERRAS